MTLADPTGGAGYIFGQSLPASHMTTIATQQVRALDAVNGGTYTCANALSMTHNALVTKTLNAGASILGTSISMDLTPAGATEALYLRVLNNNNILIEGSGSNTVSFSSCRVAAALTRFEIATVGQQNLTVDNDYSITGSLVKSTFTPSVDRTLTLSDTTPGRIVLLRITNSSMTRVIRIRDANAVLLATLGTGGGPGTAPTWIQLATDLAGNGFSLAWDSGGPWTISV